MKASAHYPVSVCASLRECKGTRVAPTDRLRGHTTSATSTCTRFRGRPVAFPLRRVGAKNRCTPDFRTEVYRARYFNPQTGRFWTMDTFEGDEEEPLSLHKYLYCQGNPVNGKDPSGRDEVDTWGMIQGGSFWNANAAMVEAEARAAQGTAGPDITAALMATLNDVDQTFTHAPGANKMAAMGNIFTPALGDGWDIGPLRDEGFQVHPDKGFGNNSTFGTGTGQFTVQFSVNGVSLQVYHAGSVNYALFGKMFSLAHRFWAGVDGTLAAEYSEKTAVAMARTHKFLVNHNVYADEAAAFVRFGYSGEDPSKYALPLERDPKNVGASTRFKWKWIGIHDTEE
jgi:RHS repeat-associated protein